jgi:predicted DNA-binding protein (MmcQ/YjbR family)
MPFARRSTLLAFCRSLPHVTEDIKWGNDLVFSVGGKMFAGFAANGKDASFGCKVSPSDFDEITRIEGIVPAAYAARFHWIDVQDPEVLEQKDALDLIRGSYDLVKVKLPQKLQRQIEGASSPRPATKKPSKKKARR